MTEANKNRIDVGMSIISTEIKKRDEALTRNVYKLLVECTGKKYSELIKYLSEKLDTKVDQDYLKKYIIKMKKEYNTRNAEEMTLIIKLSVALSKKSIKEIGELNKKINEIQKTNQYLKQANLDNNNSFNSSNKDNVKIREEKIKDMNKRLEIMSKEGKITEEYDFDRSEMGYLKNNIKEINKEYYTDYIINSNPNMKNISLNEIDQMIYTLSFFIDNLTKNLKDSNEENSLINNFKVKENTKYTGRNLFLYKIRKATSLLETYIVLRNSLVKIRDEKEIDAIADIKNKDILVLKEAKDFVYEYFSDLNEVYKIKKNIIDNIQLSEENVKIYKKLFVDKVIIDDRKHEE